VTVRLFASTTATWSLSSMSTKSRPLPSVAACSGSPPRSSVPTTVPSVESITVALGALWLKTQTRELKGSKRMPSGRPSTSIVFVTASVPVSHMVTGLLLAKPWWETGSTATPRAFALGISPTGSRVSRSKTVIREAAPPWRGMYRRRPAESA